MFFCENVMFFCLSFFEFSFELSKFCKNLQSAFHLFALSKSFLVQSVRQRIYEITGTPHQKEPKHEAVRFRLIDLK